MTGFILIDKPTGITSHDVIDQLRKITGIKKIGHAGTLDPFASGLLLIGIGRAATREMQQFVGMNKTYESEFTLGASSTTDDTEGELTAHPIPEITSETIQEAMNTFLGSIDQIPPMYSAIKKGGKKLYELARAGETVELEPRQIRIDQYELKEAKNLDSDSPTLQTIITCSSGTYIRALARDLGKALGTAGYASQLRRSAIGPFSIENALSLKGATKEDVEAKLIDVKTMLDQISAD